MRGVSFIFACRERRQCVQPWRTVFRDAAAVVLVCAAVSCLVNVIRADGIPFIQKEEYQILVPCPETIGEADPVTPDAPLLRDSQVLVVDARQARDFEAWHAARAESVPFDYLEPTDPNVIRRIASSGAREVVVYGDGQDPDSGEQLARELSGKGIRNVRFVRGGAPALMEIGQKGAAR